jgi:hypothetical protein
LVFGKSKSKASQQYYSKTLSAHMSLLQMQIPHDRQIRPQAQTINRTMPARFTLPVTNLPPELSEIKNPIPANCYSPSQPKSADMPHYSFAAKTLF